MRKNYSTDQFQSDDRIAFDYAAADLGRVYVLTPPAEEWPAGEMAISAAIPGADFGGPEAYAKKTGGGGGGGTKQN